jgi:hypothetical protein
MSGKGKEREERRLGEEAFASGTGRSGQVGLRLGVRDEIYFRPSSKFPKSVE